MSIRMATLADVEAWVSLRAALWEDTPLAKHRAQAMAIIAKTPDACAAFLSVDEASGVCAFAEAALRHDYVNGCETSPVAFLEGIYVRPQDRGRGVGAALLAAVQVWARARGCRELASDAPISNGASQAFHGALGFEETARVVFFHKRL